MQFGREKEADAGFANAGAHLSGGEIDVDAESFKHVGATAH